MLFGQVIQIHFDLIKMLLVQRRIRSDYNLAMRKDMVAFLAGAIFSSIGWHFGLYFITYNDDLYMREDWRYIFISVVILWIFGGLFVGNAFARWIAITHPQVLNTNADDLSGPSAVGQPADEGAAEGMGEGVAQS